MVHAQDALAKPFVVDGGCVDFAILCYSANVLLCDFVLFNGDVAIRSEEVYLMYQVVGMHFICLSFFDVKSCFDVLCSLVLFVFFIIVHKYF